MKIDKELIIAACENSLSMTEAAAQFSINFQTFRTYAKQLGVWKPNQSGKGIRKSFKNARFSTENILAGKHPGYGSHKLRLRLINEGIKENKCEVCGMSAHWNSKPLSLQLDHIDGNSRNNSLDNLRIICPNCHSQTETFGSKGIK